MSSEESEGILAEIANLVTPRIAESWQRATVTVQIDDERADFVIAYEDADGNPKQLEIERAIEIIPELSDCFTSLQQATADGEKSPWSRCQYTAHSGGTFETDFSWEPPDWVPKSGEL